MSSGWNDSGVAALVLIFFMMGIALSATVMLDNWQTDSQNRLAATNEFAQAFEIAGYHTVPVGENSFTVVNFTGSSNRCGNVFVDAHNLTAGKFAFTGPGSQTQIVDIYDSLAKGRNYAYKSSMVRIKGSFQAP